MAATVLLHFQAIRDGVIEASLDHENGWMQSKDTSDIYATRLAPIQYFSYYSHWLL
jgi:hypothetical protein